MKKLLCLLMLGFVIPLVGVAETPTSSNPPPSNAQFYYTVPGSDRLVPFAFAKADDPPKKDKDTKFKRGAKRSPGHKLAAAPKFSVLTAPPAKFAMIPADLEMYGNDQYGDCVSAQTACSLCAWTTFCGAAVKPTDSEVIAFARQYGLLDGADLTQVMDIMSSKGMSVGGKIYKEGGYSSVNYSVPVTFQSALTIGPVNVAIDANALPSGAGNQQGWAALGTYRQGQFPNTDHCVTFLGYGTVTDCYTFLNLPVPAGVDGTQQAYIMDTWKTLGVVNQSWVMSTMEEAWVRNPTTVGFNPPNPPPPTPLPPTPPTPPNPPVPPVPGGGFTGSIIITTPYVNGVAGQPVTSINTGTMGLDAALSDDLVKAGVNPVIIIDVLKLLADVRAKAGLQVITADLLKILTDFTAAEKDKKEKVGQKVEPAPQGEKWANRETLIQLAH